MRVVVAKRDHQAGVGGRETLVGVDEFATADGARRDAVDLQAAAAAAEHAPEGHRASLDGDVTTPLDASGEDAVDNLGLADVDVVVDDGQRRLLPVRAVPRLKPRAAWAGRCGTDCPSANARSRIGGAGSAQPGRRSSSASTARRIHADTDRSSAAALSRTASRVSTGNRTGTGSDIRSRRRTAGPCGTWLSGSA